MSEQPVAQRARQWLERQLAELGQLRNASRRDPTFKQWRQNTLTVLQRIWPGDVRRVERFRRIPFSPTNTHVTDRQVRDAYERGWGEAGVLLRQLLSEVEEMGGVAGQVEETETDAGEVAEEMGGTLTLGSSLPEAADEGAETDAARRTTTPPLDTVSPEELLAPDLDTGESSASEPKPAKLRMPARPAAKPGASAPRATRPGTPELKPAKLQMPARPAAKPAAPAPKETGPAVPALKPAKLQMPPRSAAKPAVPAPQPSVVAIPSLSAGKSPEAEPAAPAPKAEKPAEPVTRSARTPGAELITPAPKESTPSEPVAPATRTPEVASAAAEPPRPAASASRATRPPEPPAPCVKCPTPMRAATKSPAPAPKASKPATPPPPPPPPAEEPDQIGLAMEKLLSSSPLFRPRDEEEPKPAPELTEFDCIATELKSLAADLEKLGLTKANARPARAALATLARATKAGEVEWKMVSEALRHCMATPALARRALPLLTTFVDKAA